MSTDRAENLTVSVSGIGTSLSYGRANAMLRLDDRPPQRKVYRNYVRVECVGPGSSAVYQQRPVKMFRR
uniref:U650h n=1 Tax=Mycobacterium leprae TaxID=1769 RepID=Q50100_MYCLR|nr:u650h [Mycobacterium leprae]